ncbi:O6-methylguanine-DNA methyltransferase [Gluconacetobacter johannae DSM 13595]|nr:O6-methylguanine-DNA methyltransferase [Gluconacetobacter johannae DSM 13595]
MAADAATERDPRWARIVARDPSADGLFCYSVATTGVYCRPSCPSRTAKPAHVRLHDTPADARAAGFRPCLRCRPDDAPRAARNAAIVAGACRAIDRAEDMPSLEQLAGAAGLSPAYFHRLFKAETGLTPRDYAVARRGARLRRGLADAPTVTAALFDAGYGSSSRFYAAAGDLLGMPPAAWRNGGAGQTLRFAIGQCALGALLVASSDKGVCAITLGDDPDALTRDLQDRFPNAELTAGDAAYDALVARVVGFVEAPQLGLDLPLDIRGTAFQHRVWNALRAIPPGRTATYAQIARQIGAPGAVRAVAGACAANALAVAIPCHRVVRTDGSLSGYRWGVARKRALIACEASA